MVLFVGTHAVLSLRDLTFSGDVVHEEKRSAPWSAVARYSNQADRCVHTPGNWDISLAMRHIPCFMRHDIWAENLLKRVAGRRLGRSTPAKPKKMRKALTLVFLRPHPPCPNFDRALSCSTVLFVFLFTLFLSHSTAAPRGRPVSPPTCHEWCDPLVPPLAQPPIEPASLLHSLDRLASSQMSLLFARPQPQNGEKKTLLHLPSRAAADRVALGGDNTSTFPQTPLSLALPWFRSLSRPPHDLCTLTLLLAPVPSPTPSPPYPWFGGLARDGGHGGRRDAAAEGTT